MKQWLNSFHYSPSGIAVPRKAYVLLMLLSFIFFLTLPLQTKYLRMYWTDLHQIQD